MIKQSLFALVVSVSVAGADDLLEGFRNPPESALPRAWFHWQDGNVTAAGITKDLEAMKQIGLGGVQIFSVSGALPKLVDPVIVPATPAWRQMIKHAATDCDRLGLELTIHNSPGWSESGGPWVTPEQGMQKLVWSRVTVTGPRMFSSKLPCPPNIPGPFMDMPVKAGPKFVGKAKPYYADSAVLAFRLPPAEDGAAAPAISFSAGAFDGAALVDGRSDTEVRLPILQPKQTQYINYDYPVPFTCRSFMLHGDLSHMDSRLEFSADGKTYRVLVELSGKYASSLNIPRSFAVQPVTGRHFRLAITRLKTKEPQFPIAEAYPSAQACVDRWQEKAGFALLQNIAAYDNLNTPDYPADAVIRSGEVIDLSGNMTADGTLAWEVPEGSWCILRIGHSPTGHLNAPAQPEATGLECDKLSREAVTAHINAVVDPLKKDLGPLVGRSLRYLLIDSWEAGNQNWTPKFIQEFQRRRGYNPLPYLPVMAGRIVDSADVSGRFLWDFRRTIADLIADNHYGTFAELGNQLGLGIYAEAQGIGLGLGDQLQCKGRVDIPMGEFWAPNHKQRPHGLTQDIKEAASAAHIYGKRIAAAEAFTGGFTHYPWVRHPYLMKAMGDMNFCAGINRFCFHTYAHQPLVDMKSPGLSFWRFGTHIERTVTWWDNAGPLWMQYLSRCEYLLQSGLFHADLCYFYGDGAPSAMKERELLPAAERNHNYDDNRGIFTPSPPKGYDYDGCNAEVLLTRMSVRNGRIVLPDGMSYRLLVLPDEPRMTLPVVRKIKELVAAGAMVYGPRPTRSPGLSGYPQCDREITQLAAEVWGACDGKTVTEHGFGKGRVFWGKPFNEVLAGLNLIPDFEYRAAGGKPNLAYIHRTDGNTDLYFVSNQSMQAEEVSCRFRIAGRIPELWHPDTGRIEKVPLYTVKDGQTTIPMRLDPAGSVFVIFRDPSPSGSDPFVGLTRDGRSVLPGEVATVGNQPVVELQADAQGRTELRCWQNGSYELRSASGNMKKVVVSTVPAPLDVSGAWALQFPPDLGAPPRITLDTLSSLSQHPDEGVKYFSGTVTYRRTVDIPAGLLAEGQAVYLDLGDVRDIPEISLNGKKLAVLWKAPYRCEISSAAKPGPNTLEIKVTNMWTNRLIGDWKQPEARRVAKTTYPSAGGAIDKDTPLYESGLLGPVRLLSVQIRRIE